MAGIVEAFTDGSCLGNPGPGGWATLIIRADTTKEISGGEYPTTNNRMELRAAIATLEATSPSDRLIIHTDSRYLQGGINHWISDWRRNNWRTSAGKRVKNLELWRELERLSANRNIEWCWVKGHHTSEGNARADYLARKEAEKAAKRRRQ